MKIQRTHPQEIENEIENEEFKDFNYQTDNGGKKKEEKEDEDKPENDPLENNISESRSTDNKKLQGKTSSSEERN